MKLLHWGIDLLERSGNRSARAEVEQILMHLLGCRRSDLYLAERLSDRLNRADFERIVVQRTKGVPLQYLLGKSYFWHWEFAVRPGVFIPRPETELLVQQCVQLFQKAGARHAWPLHLLDLGTGSGNLAIALTKLLSHCKIRAIELSPVAVEVARENARRHGVEKQIEFIQEDWSLFLDWFKERFDGIIANPPYIPTGQIGELDPQVRMEPLLALDGGIDGLDWIRLLLSKSKRCLKERGCLIFEIGENQAARVREIAAVDGWSECGSAQDLNGIERVFWARKTSVQRTAFSV